MNYFSSLCIYACLFDGKYIDYISNASHVVHGLTTAASLWLAAAVGIACGGELYFPATFCTAIILILLRFGPRNKDEDDDEEEEEQSTCDDDSTIDLEYNSGNHAKTRRVDGSIGSPEQRSLISRRNQSLRD